MRLRGAVALLAIAAIGLAALAWSSLQGLATGASRRVVPDATSGTAADRRALPRPEGTPVMPRRDLFRFGDSPAPTMHAGEIPAAPAVAAVAAATPAPPARVRLVGFVQTQGRRKAALAIESEIDVAGPGEEVRGFRVLELDEDAAHVRLRTPEGNEIEAALAPR
jgi:hypothetical protein